MGLEAPRPEGLTSSVLLIEDGCPGWCAAVGGSRCRPRECSLTPISSGRSRMSRSALSLFARCAGLLWLFLVLPNSALAYQQPDLLGRWEMNSIASGPGAPWWERALATISPSGSFTAVTNDNSGGSGTVLGTLVLSPAGIVAQAGFSSFRGALDQGQREQSFSLHEYRPLLRLLAAAGEYVVVVRESAGFSAMARVCRRASRTIRYRRCRAEHERAGNHVRALLCAR